VPFRLVRSPAESNRLPTEFSIVSVRSRDWVQGTDLNSLQLSEQ